MIFCPCHTCPESHLSGGSFFPGVHFQYRIQVIVSSPSLPCSAPQLRLYLLAAVAQISHANSVFLLFYPSSLLHFLSFPFHSRFHALFNGDPRYSPKKWKNQMLATAFNAFFDRDSQLSNTHSDSSVWPTYLYT
jgi:hypothetical protein